MDELSIVRIYNLDLLDFKHSSKSSLYSFHVNYIRQTLHYYTKNILDCIYTESSKTRPYLAHNRCRGPIPVLLSRKIAESRLNIVVLRVDIPKPLTQPNKARSYFPYCNHEWKEKHQTVQFFMWYFLIFNLEPKNNNILQFFLYMILMQEIFLWSGICITFTQSIPGYFPPVNS